MGQHMWIVGNNVIPKYNPQIKLVPIILICYIEIMIFFHRMFVGSCW